MQKFYLWIALFGVFVKASDVPPDWTELTSGPARDFQIGSEIRICFEGPAAPFNISNVDIWLGNYQITKPEHVVVPALDPRIPISTPVCVNIFRLSAEQLEYYYFTYGWRSESMNFQAIESQDFWMVPVTDLFRIALSEYSMTIRYRNFNEIQEPEIQTEYSYTRMPYSLMDDYQWYADRMATFWHLRWSHPAARHFRLPDPSSHWKMEVCIWRMFPNSKPVLTLVENPQLDPDIETPLQLQFRSGDFKGLMMRSKISGKWGPEMSTPVTGIAETEYLCVSIINKQEVYEIRVLAPIQATGYSFAKAHDESQEARWNYLLLTGDHFLKYGYRFVSNESLTEAKEWSYAFDPSNLGHLAYNSLLLSGDLIKNLRLTVGE